MLHSLFIGNIAIIYSTSFPNAIFMSHWYFVNSKSKNGKRRLLLSIM